MAARTRKKDPKRTTSRTRVRRSTCPVCKARVETHDLSEDDYFPFCGRRCKLIDLGKWFDGDYRTSEPIEEQNE